MDELGLTGILIIAAVALFPVACIVWATLADPKKWGTTGKSD